MAKRFGFFLFLCYATFSARAQEQHAFLDQRAEENYHHLKDSTDLPWLEAIKYIALSSKRNSYLSIGGTFRPRFEHFTNDEKLEIKDKLKEHLDLLWELARRMKRDAKYIVCKPVKLANQQSLNFNMWNIRR